MRKKPVHALFVLTSPDYDAQRFLRKFGGSPRDAALLLQAAIETLPRPLISVSTLTPRMGTYSKGTPVEWNPALTKALLRDTRRFELNVDKDHLTVVGPGDDDAEYNGPVTAYIAQYATLEQLVARERKRAAASERQRIRRAERQEDLINARSTDPRIRRKLETPPENLK